MLRNVNPHTTGYQKLNILVLFMLINFVIAAIPYLAGYKHGPFLFVWVTLTWVVCPMIFFIRGASVYKTSIYCFTVVASLATIFWTQQSHYDTLVAQQVDTFTTGTNRMYYIYQDDLWETNKPLKVGDSTDWYLVHIDGYRVLTNSLKEATKGTYFKEMKVSRI